MKYIKLFEAFVSDSPTDFRVQIIGPGMKEGHYLFSTTDETGYDSIFGVFDLAGLKELEDAINTQIIAHDLINKVQDINPRDTFDLRMHYGNFKATPIGKGAKFLGLIYDEDLKISSPWDDKPDWEKYADQDTSIYDAPEGADVGILKLKDESGDTNRHHVSMGLMIVPAETEQEDAENVPVVLNQCHFIDHHGTLRSASPKLGVSIQIENHFGGLGVGFGVGYLEKIADLKDIERYLPKIFDAEVPNGFLRLLNRLKSSEADTSLNLKRFKKQYNKLAEIDFEKAREAATKSVEHLIPNASPPRDEQDMGRFKKERNEAYIKYIKAFNQAMKDYTEDVLLDMDNLINQYQRVIKDYEFEKEKELVDYWREAYDRGSRGLPPPNWPEESNWPPNLLR
jgi:hypothetical protein